MDIKTARSLEAKAVREIADKHGAMASVLEALMAGQARLEARLDEMLADRAAAKAAPANPKKGG